MVKSNHFKELSEGSTITIGIDMDVGRMMLLDENGEIEIEDLNLKNVCVAKLAIGLKHRGSTVRV